MKYIPFAFTAFSIIITLGPQSACNHSSEALPPAPADLCQIQLLGWFSHTPVKVTVDHSPVFTDTVSTGSALAFAAIIPVQVSIGTHRVNVTVADALSRDTTFTIVDTLFIGVYYDATISNISYVFQREPFSHR